MGCTPFTDRPDTGQLYLIHPTPLHSHQPTLFNTPNTPPLTPTRLIYPCRADRAATSVIHCLHKCHCYLHLPKAVPRMRSHDGSLGRYRQPYINAATPRALADSGVHAPSICHLPNAWHLYVSGVPVPPPPPPPRSAPAHAVDFANRRARLPPE
jgi:hypothetical protein